MSTENTVAKNRELNVLHICSEDRVVQSLCIMYLQVLISVSGQVSLYIIDSEKGSVKIVRSTFLYTNRRGWQRNLILLIPIVSTTGFHADNIF